MFNIFKIFKKEEVKEVEGVEEVEAVKNQKVKAEFNSHLDLETLSHLSNHTISNHYNEIDFDELSSIPRLLSPRMIRNLRFNLNWDILSASNYLIPLPLLEPEFVNYDLLHRNAKYNLAKIFNYVGHRPVEKFMEQVKIPLKLKREVLDLLSLGIINSLTLSDMLKEKIINQNDLNLISIILNETNFHNESKDFAKVYNEQDKPKLYESELVTLKSLVENFVRESAFHYKITGNTLTLKELNKNYAVNCYLDEEEIKVKVERKSNIKNKESYISSNIVDLLINKEIQYADVVKYGYLLNVEDIRKLLDNIVIYLKLDYNDSADVCEAYLEYYSNDKIFNIFRKGVTSYYLFMALAEKISDRKDEEVYEILKSVKVETIVSCKLDALDIFFLLQARGSSEEDFKYMFKNVRFNEVALIQLESAMPNFEKYLDTILEYQSIPDSIASKYGKKYINLDNLVKYCEYYINTKGTRYVSDTIAARIISKLSKIKFEEEHLHSLLKLVTFQYKENTKSKKYVNTYINEVYSLLLKHTNEEFKINRFYEDILKPLRKFWKLEMIANLNYSVDENENEILNGDVVPYIWELINVDEERDEGINDV